MSDNAKNTARQPKVHLWLGVATVLVGASLAISACGATGGCSSKSCNGCCDANGVCQPGSAANLCGAFGGACQVCAASQSCNSGTCSGGTGGGTSGTGGGNSGTGGGHSGTGGGGGNNGTGGGGGNNGTGGGGGNNGTGGGGGNNGTGGGGGNNGTGGGGGSSCNGNFSLGSTFNVGNDAYTDCSPANAPKNCLTGNFIFGSGWCKCLLACSDFNSKPKPGDACNNDLECRHIVSSSSGNYGNYCIPKNDSAWNYCFTNSSSGGGAGGGGGATGGGSGGGTGGGGGSGCFGSGHDCSFDSDCCSDNCDISNGCQ